MKLAMIASILSLASCQGEFRAAYATDDASAAPSANAPPATPGDAATEVPTAPTAPAAPTAATSGAVPTAVASTPGPAASGAPQAPTAPATAGSISGSVVVKPKSFVANLSNLVVWIDNPPSAAPAKDIGESAILDQHGMNFFPNLTVVRVGGTVTFLNDDPFPHNVFTPDGDKFNMGTMAHGAAKKKTFDKPGRFTLLCNLHPNMIAYIQVTPSSWFARPTKDGTFTMAGVPAGTYTLKAWGARLAEQTQSVTVKDGDTSVEFHLQPAD